MALSAVEEAQLRDLIAQQAALLSLAGVEPTILSKLGATKVTLSDLPTASAINDADLLLLRQGTTDKSVSGLTFKGLIPDATDTVKGVASLSVAANYPSSSDVEAATPAYVKVAMGNFNASYSMPTGNTVLNATYFGGYINYQQSSAVGSVTLPDISTSATQFGSTLTFKVTGTQNFTVNRAGADVISPNGVSLTSIVIRQGEDLFLVKAGNGLWFATGSAVTRYEPGFAALLNGNGYQKLPSGIIIQWGSVSGAAHAALPITFPIAFPTAGINAQAIMGGGGANSYVTRSTAPSTTGFTISKDSFGGVTATVMHYWMAVGY